MKEKNYLIYNNLVLKIIALIFMTLCHIGMCLNYFLNDDVINIISTIFIYVGSIAYPIFLFLLIDGLNNTSNFNKYLLRLFIGAIVVYLGDSLLQYSLNFLIDNSINDSSYLMKFGNIFIDLFLYSLIYKIIKNTVFDKYKLSELDKVKRNKNYLNYFYLFLMIIYFIITYLIKIDVLSISNKLIYSFIDGLIPQYSLVGLSLFISTLISFYIYDKKVDSIDSNYKFTNKYKFSKNIIYCILLVFFSLISYTFTYLDNKYYLGVDSVMFTYIALAIFFIAPYNYKLGYKKKLFNIVSIYIIHYIY